MSNNLSNFKKIVTSIISKKINQRTKRQALMLQGYVSELITENEKFKNEKKKDNIFEICLSSFGKENQLIQFLY